MILFTYNVKIYFLPRLRELEIKTENSERQVTKLEQEKIKLEEDNEELKEKLGQKDKELEETLKSIENL